MSGLDLTGTYATGLTLTNPANNPVTVSAGATIANPTGAALQSAAALDWTIGNFGVIQSTGTTAGSSGIALAAGGAVSNYQLGQIGGYDVGVSIAGIGTIINQGTIRASQTAGYGYSYNSTTKAFIPLSGGVIMGGGGVSNAASATIASYLEGIALGGGGSVVNSGSISATSTKHGFGVVLPSGGSVGNAASGTITGAFGILSLGSIAASVTNQGIITGKAHTSVDLYGGGFVNNAITGTITGAGNAVFAGGTTTSTVINQGLLVAGGSTFTGALLADGGFVSNAATGTITGGGRNAVFTAGSAASTVVNQGLLSGGTLTGVYLQSGGIVSNTNTGTITGPYAVAATGTVGSTVTNAGTIVGAAHIGVFQFGGVVTNATTGTIFGGYYGVRIRNAAGSVVNAGHISDSHLMAGAGVDLVAGGTVTNGMSGDISSKWIGVQIGATTANAAGTLLNQGTVFASDGTNGAAVWIHGPAYIDNAPSGAIDGGPYAIVLYNQATVVNQGTIGGTEFAVFQSNAAYAVRVIDSPGAVFSGTVEGSSTAATTVHGTLELTSGVSIGTIAGFGNSFTGFGEVLLDTGATWSLGGTVAASQTIAFTGTSASLALANPGSMAGTITGFSISDTIALVGITDVTGVTLSPSHVLTISETAGPGLTLQFDPAQTFGETFNYSVFGGATNLTLACFAAGTRIQTERDAIPVETLRRGTRVRAHFAGIAEVLWVGHRHIDCRRHPRPHIVWPIRICAGAFAPGQPATDLYLSPDHAIHLNGVLIPIRYLLNRTTIRQVPVRHVAYYHVELPHHDILLAEHLPVESYLDIGDRANFANGCEALRLFADFSTPALDPGTLWEAKACAPLVIHGPALEAARRQVNDLARATARVRSAHA